MGQSDMLIAKQVQN